MLRASCACVVWDGLLWSVRDVPLIAVHPVLCFVTHGRGAVEKLADILTEWVFNICLISSDSVRIWGPGFICRSQTMSQDLRSRIHLQVPDHVSHYHHMFNKTDTSCCQIKMGMVAYLGGDHHMFNKTDTTCNMSMWVWWRTWVLCIPCKWVPDVVILFLCIASITSNIYQNNAT